MLSRAYSHSSSSVEYQLSLGIDVKYDYRYLTSAYLAFRILIILMIYSCSFQIVKEIKIYYFVTIVWHI